MNKEWIATMLKKARDPSAAEASSDVFASETTAITFNSLKSSSALQPASGNNPYEIREVMAEEKKKLVDAELKGFWVEERKLNPDSNIKLCDIFFPDSEEGITCFQALEKDGYYGAVDRPSAVGKNGRRNVNNLKKGWKGVPQTPRNTLTDSREKLLEKEITAAFVPILNHVISTLHLSDSRVGVDGQNAQISTRDGLWLKPDVFLWGAGSPAFPHITGKPRTVADKKVRKRKSTNAQVHAGLPEPPPDIDWPWCCVPIEVKTSKSRGGPDNTDAVVQLGTYVREVFAAQTHRLFVPSLILTECTVEFLLWDRAGIVISERIDYHTQAERFCHMLASLVSWDDQRLGFDPTVFYDQQQLRIRTRQQVGIAVTDVDYIVEDTLIRSYTLLGRASTCWRARNLSQGSPGDNVVIIQDSWVDNGVQAEEDIIRQIENAGVTIGMARLIHAENVTSRDGTMDTVNGNRRHFRFARTVDADLVHTRVVWKCDGVPLSDFTSPQELVHTLHDTVNGLADMYLKAGVVHRDIVPWNILIQRGAPKGLRGVLVDFSRAAPKDSAPRSDTTPASQIFRSRNSLSNSNANSHLDDLESVYWLLLFIIIGHTGPGLATSKITLPDTPADLRWWMNSDPGLAANAKEDLFVKGFRLKVAKYFKGVPERLAGQLHRFFQIRVDEANHAYRRGEDPPRGNAEKDFQDVLHFFSDASILLDVISAVHPAAEKRKLESIDAAGSPPKKARKGSPKSNNPGDFAEDVSQV